MVPGYSAHTVSREDIPHSLSTPSALGSFASLTALCSSGIHTPYVSTQGCDADWVNAQLGADPCFTAKRRPQEDVSHGARLGHHLPVPHPPPQCLKLMLAQLQEAELP